MVYPVHLRNLFRDFGSIGLVDAIPVHPEIPIVQHQRDSNGIGDSLWQGLREIVPFIGALDITQGDKISLLVINQFL